MNTHFPTKQLVMRFVFLGTLVSIWFLLIYGGANWLTSLHSLRVPIAMPWELQIPYYPASSMIYMSIYPLFLLAPLLLPNVRELEQLTKALIVMIAFAGIVFVVLPTELAFEKETPDSWQTMVQIADAMNLEYNCVPSLHVGLSVACVTAYSRRAGRALTIFLWLWAVAIAVSTLLLHQHHLLDVITGWSLGYFCVRHFLKGE